MLLHPVVRRPTRFSVSVERPFFFKILITVYGYCKIKTILKVNFKRLKFTCWKKKYAVVGLNLLIPV